MLRTRLLPQVAAVLLTAGTLDVNAAESLTAGKFLVASPQSKDPDLARTVVLLIHCDQQGAIGIIVNRRTEVPVSRLFPPVKNPQPMYFGGPIDIGARALYRSTTKLQNALTVLNNVYAIADPPMVEAMANSQDSAVLRVYAGYTGWSTEQLRKEVTAGLWVVMSASPAQVFDAHPQSLWQRMSHFRKMTPK